MARQTPKSEKKRVFLERAGL